ncbi:MAG: DUF4149 domain-containing protein [Thermodesulfobacteriota bacterium]
MLKLALFLHITSAIFWVGGMLFISLVLAPFLMSLPTPAERSKVYQVVGKKYRRYGWTAIIILLITGPIIFFQLHGVWPHAVFTPALHGTPLGRALTIKLTFVTILVISSLVHDFWLGPKARGSKNFTTIAKIFGRSNLFIAIIIVIFAVFLRVGGI